MMIDIEDPQDRAFCDLLQGCTVQSTTFRSGWISPPEPMRIVGYQLVSLTPEEPATDMRAHALILEHPEEPA